MGRKQPPEQTATEQSQPNLADLDPGPPPAADAAATPALDTAPTPPAEVAEIHAADAAPERDFVNEWMAQPCQTPPRRDVPWYEHCTRCWDSQGGVGMPSGTLPKGHQPDQAGVRYYQCDTCGTHFRREFDVATLASEEKTVVIIKR